MTPRRATVAERLEVFSGTSREATTLRRAILRETGRVAADDALRDQIDIFIGNIHVSEVSMAAGASQEAWRALLTTQWSEIEERLPQATLTN